MLEVILGIQEKMHASGKPKTAAWKGTANQSWRELDAHARLQLKSSPLAAKKYVIKQTDRQTRAHLQLALEGIWQGHATSSTLGPQGQGSYQGVFQGISLQHCAGNGPHDYISADSCFCNCCHRRRDIDLQALGQCHQFWQIHRQQMCQECLQYSHTTSILRLPGCPKACNANVRKPNWRRDCVRKAHSAMTKQVNQQQTPNMRGAETKHSQRVTG